MGKATRQNFRTSLPPVPAYPIAVDNVVIEVRADPARPGGRLVLQDGVESSYIDIADPTHLEFEYLRHLARAVDLLHPRRRALNLLQIGGGPCALPRYLDATRRDLRAVVAEVDSGVVDVAVEHLGLRPGTRLDVRITDGRAELERTAPSSLDLLVVDAFLGLVVPHHLMTRQFNATARRALRDGGIHAINMIDIPPLDYAAAVGATLRADYRNVVMLADPAVAARRSSGNVVFVATDRDIPADRLAQLMKLDDEPWEPVRDRTFERFVAAATPLDDTLEPTHELALLGPLFGRVRHAGSGVTA